jgi:hypothetical protein
VSIEPEAPLPESSLSETPLPEASLVKNSRLWEVGLLGALLFFVGSFYSRGVAWVVPGLLGVLWLITAWYLYTRRVKLGALRKGPYAKGSGGALSGVLGITLVVLGVASSGISSWMGGVLGVWYIVVSLYQWRLYSKSQR